MQREAWRPVSGDRIDLVHEVGFSIGPMRVHPSTLEVERAGQREAIEPRVMQVLVALHRAGGAVVSKDDLIASCWKGRFVTEDAIHRVISRLRRVSEEFGQGAFRVETVPRVGYRLRFDGEAVPSLAGEARTGLRAPSRRMLLIGAAAVLTAGGVGFLYLSARRGSVPAELQAMLDQADAALDYQTPEQIDAAVGIMTEAVRLFPDRAESWAKLASAYRQQAVNSLRADASHILSRCEAAARRSIEIDPENHDAAVILTLGNGLWYSAYPEYDRTTREVLSRYPDHELARRSRASFLAETGRIRESVDVGAPLVDANLPEPVAAAHARRLWAAGRLGEAEALLDVLIERWPRHYSMWVTRYRFLLFSGKVGQADIMFADLVRRPVGLESIDFEIWEAQAEAIRTNREADIDRALRLFDGVLAQTQRKVEEAAVFASLMNRLDAAFSYLDTLFVSAERLRRFRRNFPARSLQRHTGSLTFFLFEPPMARARDDPRFESLVTRLGLTDYWRASGIPPDYLA